MATYALLSGDTVFNTVVADSIADLGALANIYDVKDVSGLEIQPSKGWKLSGDTFVAPKVNPAAAANWTGAGFDVPTEEVKDSKKDK